MKAEPRPSHLSGDPEGARRSWFRRRRGDLLAVAVLGLMTLAVFWKGFAKLEPHDSMIRGDAAVVYQPYYTMAAREVQAGRLPLWNPYVMLGVPFHAGMQSALFYPLRWPMLFMDYAPGYVFTICLHYFLGAVAAYLFMRAAIGVGPLAGLLGALSIMFGGQSVGHASHPIFFLSFPWFFGAMLCLWLGVRRGQWRWIAPLGVCIGLMGLAGSVHLLLLLGLIIGVYVAYQSILALVDYLRDRKAGWMPILRPVGIAGAAIVLGAMISAVQFLPAMKLSKLSVRQTASKEFITLASAHPLKSTLQMVVPFYYGDMRIGYWGAFSHDEMAHYAGIAVLMAAVVGVAVLRRDRHLWFWVVLALIGLALGAGDFLPFYSIFYKLAPPFRQLRNPTRIFWLMDIALACLAAVGIQQVWLRRPEGKLFRRARRVGLTAGLVILVVLAGAMVMQYHYANNPDAAEQVVQRDPKIYDDMWKPLRVWCARNAPGRIFEGDFPTWGGVGAGALSVLLLGLVLLRRRPMSSALGGLVVFVLAADLFAMSWGMIMYDKLFHSVVGTPHRAVFLKENLGLQRYALWQANPRPSEDDQVVNNLGMQFAIRHLEGDGGHGIVEMPHRLGFIQGAKRPFQVRGRGGRTQYTWGLMKRMLDVAGVRYLLMEPDIRLPEGAFRLRLIRQDNRYNIYENTTARPAAYFVRQLWQVPKGRALQAMARESFDPAEMAIVEGQPSEPTANSRARNARVVRVETVPGRWDIEVECDAPAQLVVSEGQHPGWVATIDGEQTRIYKTNDQFMSVAVPAGKHNIELRYDPPEVRQGCVITVVGLLLVPAVFFVGLVMDRRAGAASKESRSQTQAKKKRRRQTKGKG